MSEPAVPGSPRATAMITAIGGVSVGEQILKALRIAGGYRIVGVDMAEQCVNFEHVDEAFVVPCAADPAYLEALLTIAEACGVQVLFPGSEAELKFLSDHRAEVAEAGILLPIAPREVIEIGMDKLRTAAFLDDHRFAHPRFARISGDVIDEVDWYPVVVKPAVGGGGSMDCYIAQTPRELECLAELMTDGATEMMVQEYVGRPDAEFTVGVLHDLDGQFVNSIAIRRELHSVLNVRLRVPNRTSRSDLGPTLVLSSGFSQGSVGGFEEVRTQCEAVAAALGVRGPVNIQCRLVDGVVQIFEINPRYSGTTSLRAMVGYNEPDAMVRRHLLGEVLTMRAPYRTSRIHRSLMETIVPSSPARPWTVTRAAAS
jgi:carbamoyl-phosphate synthase large subunit